MTPPDNNRRGMAQLSEPSIREPIAIVGIGCRFPGDAKSPEDFWKLLSRGVNAVTQVPTDRWQIGAFYDSDPAKPGKTYVRYGGFINDIDLFDSAFFGISPREASRMDPQHRLLLEVAYEALEDGGIAPERIAGSNTGAFIGISSSDYGGIQTAVSERHLISAYTNIGLGLCISANRISYFFDLHGPSFAVDTACSSSLVAVHLACQSIWNGECEMALTGGVNAILRPEGTIGFSKASMLSPSGTCKSFDAGADGYVRAEGAGVILLKPLAKALNDGDPIYCVIRGTAINQDGRTGGLAFPNRLAQETLLKEVYEQAGILPEHVDYIESHGTGTSAGDPIEINAIGNALAKNRPPRTECLVGSVKTNIGHLEAASGIAGLIKVALALKHGTIPKNLHYETPNPEIDFEGLKIRVPVDMEPWPKNGRDYGVAGVNSFGFGGTNAHVILSMNSTPQNGRAKEKTSLVGSSLLLPISARSSDALKALAGSYLNFLTDWASNDDGSLSDICYSASLRRGHHDHRLALVVRSRDELKEQLEAFLKGEARLGMSSERRLPGKSHKLAFVFSGMGPQWWAMGRELLKEEPVFTEAINRCDSLLRKHAAWSLLNELMKDEKQSRINETHIAQPAIFSLQIALSALWRHWGIEPDVIVGHSVGEVAAAHVAGALTLEDAVCVIFHRSRLQRRTAGQGAMLAVGLNMEEAEHLLKGYEERVSVGAINSPNDVTLSGDAHILKEIAESLQKREIFARFLRVEVPYHSPKMDPIKGELFESLKGIRPQSVTIPMLSTVTGREVEGAELKRAYWCKNIRDTVLFANAIDELIRTDHNLFVELGPHPVLATSISKCLSNAKKEGTVIHSLRRQEPERTTILGSFGKLYTLGYPVDWNRLYPNGGSFIKLPPYPWQKEQHWHESEKSRRARVGEKVHPLLGAQLESACPTWAVELDKNTPQYLEDHRVQNSVMYPGSAYVEMALAAARESFGQETCALEEIMLQRPIILSGKELLTAQLILDSKQTSFDIYSNTDSAGSPWVRNAMGKLRRLQEGETSKQLSLEKILRRCKNMVSKNDFYQKFYDVGIQYGPCFQGVGRLWCGKRESLGEIRIHSSLEAEFRDYLLHPALLDSCFQVIQGSIASEQHDDLKGIYLPVHIESVRLYRQPGHKLFSHVVLKEWDLGHLKADIELLDEAGNAIAEIQGFRCQFVPTNLWKTDSYFYEYKWELTPRRFKGLVGHGPDYIPSPLQIAKTLKPEAERLIGDLNRKKYYESFHPQLSLLVNAFIVKSFKKLGCNFSNGQTVSLDFLIKKLRIVPQQQRFFERLLGLLAEDGTIRKTGNKWKFEKLLKAKDPQEIWKSLWFEFPEYLSELMLLRQCTENLAEVLSGKVDPFELIFPQGSLTTLEHLFQDSPTLRIHNLLVQKTIAVALERLPEGRTVRILEIGGGTGGTTSYSVRKLPADRTEYVFTDVSQLFLNHAEQKFRDYPFVRYQLLDIEKDPTEQGFQKHSFDMILASDVLHATRDLHETLNRVKQLLAPQGVLILLEGTHPAVHITLIFGMLKGWWLFDDDLRKKDTWISLKDWQNLLEDEGFTEVAFVTDTKQTDEAVLSVIIARAPDIGSEFESEEPAALARPEKEGTWLVFADRKGVGNNLGEQLKDLGEIPILISAGKTYRCIDENHFVVRPGNLDDIKRAIKESLDDQPECRGVIHLWSLDTPCPEGTSLSFLENANDLGCISVLHLVQVLASEERSNFLRLFLVTSGVERVSELDKSLTVGQAPLWGLSRVIANEHPNFRSKIIDISQTIFAEEIKALFLELWFDDEEDEIALRGNIRYVHRLVRVSHQGLYKTAKKRGSRKNDRPFSLEITTPGLLDSLKFKSLVRTKPGAREVEVEIHAAALNFKDIMIAMGLLPDEALEGGYTGKALGMEGAGRITAVGEGVKGFKVGDEVVVCGPGIMRTHGIIDSSFVVKKPAHLNFEEAATVPIAFLTAYYSMHKVGQARKGERILIHAAAGGVGLAAIQLAHRAEVEPFATAGSASKRELLKALGVRHVMNSRSLAFADEVMEITKGTGVNIVLNSLSGEAIQKSISVLAPYGRFIEIGKRDIYENNKLELRPFRKNLSYYAVDLDRLCRELPELGRELLYEVMKFFEDKELSPLPFRVFPISEIVNAFRYMAQAKHIGKVVVSFQDREVDVVPLPPKKFKLHEDGTYLVTGGLGGFGLATAMWLVRCGAKHLVLIGRRGAYTKEAVSSIRNMKRSGVEVVVAKADVTKKEHVARVIKRIHKKMHPLRGIIHAAMVIDDGILLQLNEERMSKVMAPKVIGAWNLHTQTLDLPLDFFVLFSSFTSLFGNPGQGNYTAANSFLDALAYYRRALRYPALSVNWGAIGDVGYVADNPEVGENLEHFGIKSIKSELCLRILEELLQHKSIQTGVAHLDWQQLARFLPIIATRRFSHLVEARPSGDGDEDGAILPDTIMALKPEDRRHFLESFICERLARVLGTSPSRLDVNQPLLGLGIDSLMAVEIGNQIQMGLGVNVPTVKFMEGVSVSGLANYLIERLDAKGLHDGKSSKRQAPESIRKFKEVSDQKADLSLDKPPVEKIHLDMASSPKFPLYVFQSKSSKQPLFLMHPIGGNIFCYGKLSRYLGKEQPIYAIPSPGLNGGEGLVSRIEDMADQYISSMQSVQNKGPYRIGGWSMGGMVAFEMAQKLKEQGEKVSLLALIDIQNIDHEKAEPESVGYFFAGLVRDLGLPLDDNDTLILNDILQIDPDKKWKNFMDFAKDDSADKGVKGLLRKLALYFGLTTDQTVFLLDRYYEIGRNKLLEHVGEFVEFVNRETLNAKSSKTQRRLQIYFNNYLALRDFKPKVYKDPVVHYMPRDQIGRDNRDSISRWKKYFAGRMKIHKVPGDHFTMMDEPNVIILAKWLREDLRRTSGN